MHTFYLLMLWKKVLVQYYLLFLVGELLQHFHEDL